MQSWGPQPDLNLCCNSLLALGIYVAFPHSEPGKQDSQTCLLLFSALSGRSGRNGRWGARQEVGGRRGESLSVWRGETEAEGGEVRSSGLLRGAISSRRRGLSCLQAEVGCCLSVPSPCRAGLPEPHLLTGSQGDTQLLTGLSSQGTAFFTAPPSRWVNDGTDRVQTGGYDSGERWAQGSTGN